MYSTPSVGCRGSIFRKGTSSLWLGCVFFALSFLIKHFFQKRYPRHTFQTTCERATLFFASVDATDDPDRRLGLWTGLHPKVDKSEPRFARLRVRILRIYSTFMMLSFICLSCSSHFHESNCSHFYEGNCSHFHESNWFSPSMQFCALIFIIGSKSDCSHLLSSLLSCLIFESGGSQFSRLTSYAAKEEAVHWRRGHYRKRSNSLLY